MMDPIVSTAAQSLPTDPSSLDFFFPFFWPGCGCDVGHPAGPLPLGALVLLVLAFVVVRLGCFSRRR
jgi:hypothetical protein